MELMCTETLEDFESPSKERLKKAKRPLPVLIQNITRVHAENAQQKGTADLALPIIEHQAFSDVPEAKDAPLPQAGTPNDPTSSLMQLADVVLEQS